MNQVDVSPETVASEYDKIYQKWSGETGGIEPESIPEQKNQTLTPEPNFEPERVVSPDTLKAQGEIDIPMSTLQKWADDEEISPELLRHNIYTTREFIKKNTRFAIDKMAKIEVDAQDIDDFAECNAKLIVDYYPKGGVAELMDKYGLWMGAIGSSIALVVSIKQGVENKQLETMTEGDV